MSANTVAQADSPQTPSTEEAASLEAHRRTTVLLAVVVATLALCLGLLNLTLYPRTWFDEGSHLHVPKALILFGAYADYSSDGLRYYGPTLGVGPTVLLPIAAIFKIFGMGLYQARLVIVAYSLLGLAAFYVLARQFMTPRAALTAVALLLTARGVGYVEYGRQVLGEVPGLVFMILGFWYWFKAWTSATTRRESAQRKFATEARLAAAGLLLGLAAVTKNQYLLVLAPTLLIAWGANLLYYRQAPQRIFLIPGIVTASAYVLWQVILLIGLGPGNISENLVFLREATAGAALVFSPQRTAASLAQLLSARVYLGALVPGVVYGVLLALPRRRDAQQWGVLVLLVVINLGWYALASIGWIRYAFPALALACLLVTRFFYDLTIGFWWPSRWNLRGLRKGELMRIGLLIWLGGILASSTVLTLRDVVFPSQDDAGRMAHILNETVPVDAVVETWEPEMGFLTDHRYHYPPSGSLNRAVAHIWLNGPSPATPYLAELEAAAPPYVLEGEFARWVDMYPADWLSAHYTLISEAGVYRLYERNP